MAFTEHYNLKKPEQTDFYNIDDFNENMVIIDQEMKRTSTNKLDLHNPTGTGYVSVNRKAGAQIGGYSSAVGYDVIAGGQASHAEGKFTVAGGQFSHAEGSGTKAQGVAAHAQGVYTTALTNQHAQGHYNNSALATENSTTGTSNGTAFVIGNGTTSTPSNAFRITGNGEAIGRSSFASSGADYAEYFEWEDGNGDNEDRAGYFVTFSNGEFIKKAEEGDYILGIVSGMPCVIGNNDECWRGQYLMDDFGRFIYETTVQENETTGEIIEETFYKVNPNFNPENVYEHRRDRPEWAAIGMVGVLSVRDDGTCVINGYCKCGVDGIATFCEKGENTYRVIDRVKDNIVKVVFR